MKKILCVRLVAASTFISCLLSVPVVEAVTFSVDPFANGLPGSDVAIDSAAGDVQLQNNIYEGGIVPLVGTNKKIINGGAPGLAPPNGNGNDGLLLQPNDNVNALSKGNDPTSNFWDIAFSVDPASIGKVGSAVNAEAALNSAAGQIFWTNNMVGLLGNNFTKPWADEQQHGLDDVVTPEDNLDAMDIWHAGDETTPVNLVGETFYLSLEGSADIMKAPGGSGALVNAFGAAQLGLVAGDDIDALVLNAQEGIAIFSLAPGSVSLGINRSAADIFISNMNGANNLLFTHIDLGLLFEDNVDALEISAYDPVRPGAVPLPSAFWLFGSGLLSLLVCFKRKSR